MTPAVVIAYGRSGSGRTLLARAFYETYGRETVPPSEHTALAFILTRAFPDRDYHGAAFRAPHYTASEAALVGTVRHARGIDGVRRTHVIPGEVSLAHCGVLLLDELPEFRARALDCIASALLRGYSRLIVASDEPPVDIPCRPRIVVCTVNPCACTALSGSGAISPCRCTAEQIKHYHDRVRPFCAKLGVAFPG